MSSQEVKHTPDEIKDLAEYAKSVKFPRIIHASVSNVCNARCPNCPCTNDPQLRKGYGDRVFPPLMSKKIWDRIADGASKYGSMIRLSGSGEPLLHKDIVDFMVSALNKGAKVSLITNGSVLDQETILRLLKAGIESIEISVDAMNAEDYAKVRVGLDWDTTYKNIITAKKLRDEGDYRTLIMVSIINQPTKIPNLDKAVEFWKERVDNVILRKYLRWGFMKSDDVTEPFLEKRIPCPLPFERIVVNTGGYVHFCTSDPGSWDPVGDLNLNTLEEVWNSDLLRKWRQYQADGEWYKIPLCRQCNDWQFKSWDYNVWHAYKVAKQKKSKTGSKGR